MNGYAMPLYEAELHQREKIQKKLERLRGLQALMSEYEELGVHPRDSRYVDGLRKRIHSAQSQLKAMTGE